MILTRGTFNNGGKDHSVMKVKKFLNPESSLILEELIRQHQEFSNKMIVEEEEN